ncbi:MAG: hypothetical protein Q8O58_04730, partial [Gallionella sp.]|nr:hypothetical protein [Gallionella sp.]
MFKNLRIGTRLAASFAAVVLVFLASLLLVGVSFTHLMQDIRQIKEETLPFVLVVDEMDASRIGVQQWLTDVSATHNRDGYADAEEAAKRFFGGVEKYKQMYRQENDTDNLKKMEVIEADFNNLYATGKEMAEAYISKGLSAGNAKMEDFDKSSEAVSVKLAAFREQQVAEANSITASTLSSAQSTMTQMIISGAVATLLAVIFAFWITRNLLRQLGGEPAYVTDVVK